MRLLGSLKGQSHEIDRANFKIIGRYMLYCEPQMVFKILYLFNSVICIKCSSSGSTKHLPISYLLNVPLTELAEQV